MWLPATFALARNQNRREFKLIVATRNRELSDQKLNAMAHYLSFRYSRYNYGVFFFAMSSLL